MLLDDLVPLVHVETPVATAPMIRYQLIMVARDLCTFSLAWQEDVTLTLDGSDLYTLTPSAGVLAEPMSARFTTGTDTGASFTRLEPTTRARLDASDPSWPMRMGSPRQYQLESSTEVRFVPRPESGTVIFRLALQPSITEGIVDDRVGEVFRDALISGALTRLYRMPIEGLYNAALAAFHEEKYELGKGAAQVRGVDGFTKPVRRVRYGGL